MSIHPADLETLLQEHMGEPGATIHDMTDDGGYGLVRWSRQASLIPGGREHIVHRWATVDTSGVVRWPRGHFYSGGYYQTEAEARGDYRDRP